MAENVGATDSFDVSEDIERWCVCSHDTNEMLSKGLSEKALPDEDSKNSKSRLTLSQYQIKV